MNSKQVTDILDALALRFGATGEMLWAALVKQAYVDAIQSVIIILIAGSVLLFTYKKHKQIGDWADTNDGEFMLVGLAALNIICFVCVFVSIVSLPSVLNPEYYALELIIKALKPE